MKADPEVKMISAEAPILFAKGCDIFITELTMRAWIHAEENKRRTLQRSDIASALAKSDMFDFLIDIVPREEAASHAKRATGQAAPPGPGATASAQIPQQHIPQQASHAMPPPDSYNIGHSLAPEQDYRGQGNMYAAQVQPGAAAPYGAPQQQMYGEMEGMYGYPPMQGQQVNLPLFLQTPCLKTDHGRICTKSRKADPTIPLARTQVIATHDMTAEKETLMLKARETTMSAKTATRYRGRGFECRSLWLNCTLLCFAEALGFNGAQNHALISNSMHIFPVLTHPKP